MSRPQKQCIFCNNPANSKEHFWSAWMHDLLPQLPDPRHDRKTFEYHPSEGHQVRGPQDRSGGVQTIKLRVVCVSCNTGWMRLLDEAARPFLTPLITGSPVALDFEQMALVARWIALKCMVAEHAERDVFVTPRSDRAAFRDAGTIPDYFRIYLFSHNLEHGIGFKRQSLAMSLTGPVPDPPPWGTPKNIETISFFLGRVVIHLNAVRIENYSIQSRFQPMPFH